MSNKLIPPFTEETARSKVKAAQYAWNSRDPERVALAYTEDSQWRNRDEFFTGREAIKEFLTRKPKSSHWGLPLNDCPKRASTLNGIDTSQLAPLARWLCFACPMG